MLVASAGGRGGAGENFWGANYSRPKSTKIKAYYNKCIAHTSDKTLSKKGAGAPHASAWRCENPSRKRKYLCMCTIQQRFRDAIVENRSS